mgnify:CR=1 FL=1
MLVHIGSINCKRAVLLKFAGTEGYLFQQTIKQSVKTARTDVFGLLVELPGDLRDAADGIFGKLYLQSFCSQ